MSAVEAYVAELGRATTGRAATGRPPRILTEARDHLLDAAETGVERGLPRPEAERRAVASFGEVAEIAPAYRASLGLARVRRSALALLLLMIAQPLLWGVYQSDAEATDGALGVMNRLVESVGMAYLVGCPLLLVASALLLRRRELTAVAAQVVGGFTVVAAVAVLVLGVGMNLLTVGTPEASTVLDVAFTAAAIGPMLVPTLLAVRGARLVRA